MSDQQHQSDPRILNRRSLESDHRCLPKLLRSGYSVLDVGCGTGSITAGIASAVGPGGKVLGVDRDRGLIELARKKHAKISNLSFDEADATRLPFEGRFDLVTAARTLQWIGRSDEAVAAM